MHVHRDDGDTAWWHFRDDVRNQYLRGYVSVCVCVWRETLVFDSLHRGCISSHSHICSLSSKSQLSFSLLFPTNMVGKKSLCQVLCCIVTGTSILIAHSICLYHETAVAIISGMLPLIPHVSTSHELYGVIFYFMRSASSKKDVPLHIVIYCMLQD